MPNFIENRIKCVVVGDGGCGKTSLLTMFTEGEFPEMYTPTVFENYSKEIDVGKQKAILTLWDTAGQEDYDRLRPLSYDKANVIVMCYDVTNVASFENIEIRWTPEVKHFCGDIPRVLVACKTDLRPPSDEDIVTSHLGDERSLNNGYGMNRSEDTNGDLSYRTQHDETEMVTTDMGTSMAVTTSATCFIECSAKNNLNVNNVFMIASEQALKPISPMVDKSQGCCILV